MDRPIFLSIAFATRLIALFVLTLAAIPAQHAQGVRRGIEARPAAVANGGFGTYHAVIFAVGDQMAGSGLPSLKYPLREADSLRAVLTREYTFDAIRVQLVRNPTREAILDTLEILARRLGPEDNLLVVYSGHGGFDEGAREGYWQATDAAVSRPSTWIANDQIRAWLRKLKARSVLLITDACFSGSINRSGSDRAELSADAAQAIQGALAYARRSSRQAMTAGTAKETVPQVSVFSMEIVAALKRRQAPVYLAQQLAAEINPRVASVARTTPTFSAVPGIESDQGDFVFVRRTVTPVAVVAAPVLTQAPAGMQRGGPQPNASTSTSKSATGAGRVSSANARGDAAGAVRAPVARPVQGCEGGLSTGCVNQGLNAELGRNGIARDYARAAGYFKQACDVGDPDGCVSLARMYDSPHTGVSMDRGKSRTFYAQGCDGGAVAGCTALGLAATKGEGGPVDDAKAVALFTRACDGGHTQGCALLGIAYAKGKGVVQDDARAAALFTQACNSSDAAGCNGVAVMLANGRGGLTRDVSRAAGLYRQSCEQNFVESCASLGSAYLTGTGVLKDDVRAVGFFSQACEGGYAAGCSLLGAAYENGTSATARSERRAYDLYRRGCDGGDQLGCNAVKRLPKPTTTATPATPPRP